MALLVRSSPAEAAVVERLMSQLGEVTVVVSVADGARGITATAALFRSDTDMRQQFIVESDTETLVSGGDALGRLNAMTASQYSNLIMDALLDRVVALGIDGRHVPTVLSAISPTIDSIVDSQLLAATAAAVLDAPDVFADASLSDGDRSTACLNTQMATDWACRTVYHASVVQDQLARFGGREGRRLAVGIYREVRHMAVRRLQVALLDQLAAHAGMGVELPELQQQDEGQQGEGQGQQGGQPLEQGVQEAAGGWEGSGDWWLARQEARQRKLLAVDGGDGGHGGTVRAHGCTAECTAGWLEDDHCYAIAATFDVWRMAEEQGVAAAGVPAGPPPLLAARLATRAAEALCRLCRGQGLGGAYAPAPEWELAKAKVGQAGARLCLNACVTICMLCLRHAEQSLTGTLVTGPRARQRVSRSTYARARADTLSSNNHNLRPGSARLALLCAAPEPPSTTAPLHLHAQACPHPGTYEHSGLNTRICATIALQLWVPATSNPTSL